jgi:hypothetical protein
MNVYPANLNANVLIRHLSRDKESHHVRTKLSNIPDALPGFALRMIRYHSANTVFVDAGRVFAVYLCLSLCAVYGRINRDNNVKLWNLPNAVGSGWYLASLSDVII